MDRRCVFLDRDGVLNEDRPEYAYRIEHFNVFKEVPEALKALKAKGFLLIVITNQSGISQGIYTQADMDMCHDYLQQRCGHIIDHFYFSPYHPTVTASLSRKPGTLLFEKAISRFLIDASKSWMIGDRESDLVPAHKLGLRTIQISGKNPLKMWGDYAVQGIQEATSLILSGSHHKT